MGVGLGCRVGSPHAFLCVLLRRGLSPHKTKAVPALKEKGGGEEGRWGWQSGGGGEKKEDRGGGTQRSLVGTNVHIPCGGGVEVVTVTGLHTFKCGVVLVRYPNNPKLYEVERHLIFGTAEAAEAHFQKVRKGKTPTTNPPLQRTP